MTVSLQSNLNSVHQAQEGQQQVPRPQPQATSTQAPDTVQLSQDAKAQFNGGAGGNSY
jgi:hypothetical protein